MSGEPAALLQAARGVIASPRPETAGLWPRAAALLGRQALESALERHWTGKLKGLADCPARVQLVCLREMSADRSAAGRLYEAWAALSRACHHHPYELAPTAAELETWFAVVEAFTPGKPR